MKRIQTIIGQTVTVCKDLGFVAWYFCFAVFLMEMVFAFQVPTAKASLAFNPDISGRKIELPAQAVDMHKLAKAIALHETKDCGIEYGAARYSNCFGFRNSKGFMKFKTKEESYKKFHQVWTDSYGGGLPTLKQATCWVCGCDTPTGQDCSGGSPKGWQSSVMSIYASL